MDFLFRLTSYNPKNTHIQSAVDDFSRRYSNTYMQLKTKHSPTVYLVYIHTISKDYLEVTSFITTKDRDDPPRQERSTIPLVDIEDIEVFLPEPGYYQVGNVCRFLARKIARQFKRSLSDHTYLIKGITIQHLMRESNFDIKLSQLDEDSPKTALSRTYAVEYKKELKHSVLLYKEEPIAKINFRTKTLTLLFEELQQEVQDFIHRKGNQEWKIKNA